MRVGIYIRKRNVVELAENVTTKVTHCFVTYDICKREGEDECIETWRDGHRRFFEKESKELGYEFSEDLLVIFEDFEVVYRE